MWFFADAATAYAISQILVHQLLALFLAHFFGECTDLSALFTSMYAVALDAFLDVPALAVGIGDVSFLACALLGFNALFAVPYLVAWAGAAWHAVGLVASVSVVVASTFAWAMLECTSVCAELMFEAVSCNSLLHSLYCADHVSAVYSWQCNAFAVLVEFAFVQTWAVGLLDASAVVHYCTSWALATLVALLAGWDWAIHFNVIGHVVACSVAEAVGWNQWMSTNDLQWWCLYYSWCCCC